MLDVLNPLKRLTHIHHFLRDFGKQAPDCETRTDLFELLCRLAVERAALVERGGGATRPS